MMADGSKKPIEQVRAGENVMAIDIPGLRRDEHDSMSNGHPEYEWVSNGAMDDAKQVAGYVVQTRAGTHDGFFVINARLKATFEHPFLIRRDDQYHFTSAEYLLVGDAMMKPGGVEEVIESIEQIDGVVATYNFEVQHFNTYLAEGVWVHNTSSYGGSSDPQGFDLTVFSSTSATSSSGSGSGSEKSSGSGSGVTASGTPSVSGPQFSVTFNQETNVSQNE